MKIMLKMLMQDKENNILAMFISIYKTGDMTKIIKSLQENTQYTKNKWEMEGNLEMLEEDWENMLKSQ